MEGAGQRGNAANFPAAAGWSGHGQLEAVVRVLAEEAAQQVKPGRSFADTPASETRFLAVLTTLIVQRLGITCFRPNFEDDGYGHVSGHGSVSSGENYHWNWQQLDPSIFGATSDPISHASRYAAAAGKRPTSHGYKAHSYDVWEQISKLPQGGLFLSYGGDGSCAHAGLMSKGLCVNVPHGQVTLTGAELLNDKHKMQQQSLVADVGECDNDECTSCVIATGLTTTRARSRLIFS